MITKKDDEILDENLELNPDDVKRAFEETQKTRQEVNSPSVEEKSKEETKEVEEKIEELSDEVSEIRSVLSKISMQESMKYSVSSLDNWHKLPLSSLKTKGMFLPNDTVILVKAANGSDIKTFSTIIENDRYSIEEHLNLIIERCVKLISNEVPNFNWKFLNVVDRFYLLLTVKALTFPDEKNIKMKLTCPECNTENEIDFGREKLKDIELDEDLAKFYDPVEKCFKIDEKGHKFNLYAMTLGHSLWADEYAHQQQQKGISLNNIRGDLKMCMFLTKNHNQLFNKTVNKKAGGKSYVQRLIDETNNEKEWPLDKILIANKYIDKIMDVFDLEVAYQCKWCNEDVASPINFPRGVKSVLLPDSYLETVAEV